MTELAAIIARLRKIAAKDDLELRDALKVYVRDLEKQFERAERDLEMEFDNYPI